MRKLLTILLLAISMPSFAVDIDLLKQSLVGTWHPRMKYDNDNPNDENQLYFYLDGDNLMVKYVADYSWICDNADRKTFNKYGTCVVKVNYDGTIEFHVERSETAYDRKGNEERKGYREYTYYLFFVDGQLDGTETWGRQYLITQPRNNRGLVRFKTIEQAERRGYADSFPFGNDPFTTPRSFYNSDKTNIRLFYNNGVIDELSNCDFKDYKYSFLLGLWDYTDDVLRVSKRRAAFDIKIFGRDGNYYVRYRADDSGYGVVRINPYGCNGEVSFSFATQQEFIDVCNGYDWPWKYDFSYVVNRVNDERLSGTRRWTNVSGPIKACDITEPENCNVIYYKRK